MERIAIGDWTIILKEISLVFENNFETLSAMDARMGDGDLGITMRKGFGALPEIFSSIEEPDIGRHLFKAGMKLASVIPSTMGTIMASGFMEGGKKLIGKADVEAADLVAFLDGFSEGIAKRGKCKAGERTVLDASLPAAARACTQSQDTSRLELIALAAWEGSKEGVENTKQMLPKYGKAAVFSDKALGTADQGATAMMLLLEGLYNGIRTIGEKQHE
jgi:dihydroxyacetone kinase-like protein